MATTLEIITTKGKQTVQGDAVGPFLVHENLSDKLIEDEPRVVWVVTHRESTAKFPWLFMCKEAAIAFAEDVMPLKHWSGQLAVPDQDEGGEPRLKMRWLSTPTKEENDAITLAAKKRGAFTA